MASTTNTINGAPGDAAEVSQRKGPLDNKVALKLLQRNSGNVEMDQFGKDLLSCDQGIEDLLSPELLKAYYICGARSNSEILQILQTMIGPESPVGQKNAEPYLLALRILDPSEKSLRLICDTVRRVAYFQTDTLIGSKEKKERTVAFGYIEKLDQILQPFEGSDISLKNFYNQHYTSLNYKEIRASYLAHKLDVLETPIRLAEGTIKSQAIKLNIGKVRELRPIAHGTVLGAIMDWLIEVYNSGTLKDHAIAEIMECCKGISSVSDIIILACRLHQMENSPDSDRLIQTFTGAVKNYMTGEQDKILEHFFAFLITGDGAGEDIEIPQGKTRKALLDLITREIPEKYGEYFVKAFIKEKNLVKARYVYLYLPENCKKKIIAHLNKDSFALVEPLALKTAIIIKMPGDKMNLGDYISRHPRADSKEGLDMLARQAEGVIKMAWGDTLAATHVEKLNISCGDLYSKFSKREAARNGERTAIRMGTAGAAATALERATLAAGKKALRGAGKGALEGSAKKSPVEILRNKVEELDLPEEIVHLDDTLRGFKNALQEALADIMADAELMAISWGDVTTKTIDCEPNSLLAKLGITQISFTKTKSFEIELIFEGGPLKAHLDDSGRIEIPSMGQDKQWLKADIEAHILRLLLKLLEGSEREGYDLKTMLNLEGLENDEDYAAVPDVNGGKTTQNASAPSAVSVVATETLKEDTPEAKTQAFLAENYAAYEQVLAGLRDQGSEIPGDFKELLSIIYSLQERITINKVIPPGCAIAKPEHILKQFIEGIEIFNPLQSREQLDRLGIQIGGFHSAENFVDENGKIITYLTNIHIHLGSERILLHACISPRNQVYIMGVDPKEAEDTKDKLGIALVQLILEAFRIVVMRESDPANTHPGLQAPSGGGPLTTRLRQIREEIAKSQFPVHVPDWRPIQDSHTGTTTTGTRRTGLDRGSSVEQTFEDIFTAPGTLPEKLQAQCYLLAADYLAYIPNGESIFPRHALMKEGNQTTVKRDYKVVYVPIDTTENTSYLIEYLKQHLINPSAEGISLENIIAKELGKTGVSAEKIFEQMIGGRIGGQSDGHVVRVDPVLQRQCRAFYRNNAYGVMNGSQLFNLILSQSQEEDSTISEQEILTAFSQMSPLNPEKIFLATNGNGATDYRLPYMWSKEKLTNLPTIFSEEFDVPAELGLEPLTIIAGSRARVTATYDKSLRGKERGEGMDFAWDIQDPYQSARIGRAINLKPRTRALLVWEFQDGTYDLRYLDADRDGIDPQTLQPKSATAKLPNYPKVSNALKDAGIQNQTGVHTDFSDYKRWKPEELIRLERDGVIVLHRDQSNRVDGIISSKPIRRKKVVMFKEEQIGYRQFQFPPTNLSSYLQYCHDKGHDNGADIAYDAKTAKIQSKIYNLLEL